MNPLNLADFESFFRELHGNVPYDWQTRLARRVVDGTWPGAIDLPTGSGKTACLDIAVFALACQASWDKSKRTAARRIFFCVNRRVIVDEAHKRAEKIAKLIWKAELDGDASLPTLQRVAAALRSVSGIEGSALPPLDVLELRGGIYRDSRWARSATQPTIVCTTIDQLGSRLLFRGYGVSPNAAPIQAALIAYDSLILLDEAHISQPFLQSLKSVQNYLVPARWAEQDIGVRPMDAVPMTATPPDKAGNVIRLEAKDRENVGLDSRLKASKPAKLMSSPDIVASAVAEAMSFASRAPTAVGIIVNRVATAKAIYRELKARQPEAVVELVIGSMRPIDRDDQANRLVPFVDPNRRTTSTTCFVVATQCLEVGADYDFDALVTECASLDALRQRFGRLNRGGRPIETRAAILIDSKQIKQEPQLDNGKPLDPIYGNALSRTWNWLNEHAENSQVDPGTAASAGRKRRLSKTEKNEDRCLDFGIDSFTRTLTSHGVDGRIPNELLAPSASLDSPVMLPAYVDFWCQTSPRPTPDPEVSLFIHGPQSGEPDVQVCWRTDFEDGAREDWCDIVALLPPSSAECMTVPISRLRRWLTGLNEIADQGDLLGTRDPEAADDVTKGKGRKRLDESRAGVLWRGTRESDRIRKVEDLKPGDTLVLPEYAGGWDYLGHIPPSASKDVAESAFRMARNRAALRLHPALFKRTDSFNMRGLLERIADPEVNVSDSELRQLLREATVDLDSDSELAIICRYLTDRRFGLIRENYPDDRGSVLTTRRRVKAHELWLPDSDEGDDARSWTARKNPVSLADHTMHVRAEVTRTVDLLPADNLRDAFQIAANFHDIGKADERFQAMLRRTDRTDAWMFVGRDSALIAKSGGIPQTPRQQKEARERAGLPEGFRHEMLSVQLIQHCKLIAGAENCGPLILHLIAAHHGFARPFAPIVSDAESPDVTSSGFTLTGNIRSEVPPHRIDSGIADRFWQLTRRYGWWGLAYLEAVLRLADQQASADEDAGVFDPAALAEELKGQ